VDGSSLKDRLEEEPPLELDQLVNLVAQACAALDVAHRQGIVHRDLKLENLMLDRTGILKVMDFGIARVAGSEHLTRAGFMLGTPAFMAPEQVQGREIDARTDLYAMGVVFHHLITAKLPFRGETPMALAESQATRATEASVRGFWKAYRRYMED
jgi:serine/threonine-protein kinase